MKTEDIDLTRCINLRYRARIGDHHVIGRIGFDEDGYVALLHNGVEPWRGNSVEEIMKIHGMEDFEIVPRDPETYRDWQVGDVIGSLDEYGKIDDVVDNQCRVIFRSGELVAIAENYSAEEADINGCYTCSQLFREGWRLVLTDIEQRIIEEKKRYEPQDGDICYVEASDGYCSIFIYKNGFRRTNYYVSLDTDKGCLTRLFTTGGHVVADSKITALRPATDEEKRMLFDAMENEGMRWNAEKKVVEDIPKPYEFKKGEPVLVRSDRTHCWQLRAISLSVYGNPPKVEVTDGCDEWIYWIDKDDVIPYNERTMHLLGTSEDYKEGE